jgi:MYXO-CTERM domain-containing protein
MRKNAQGGRTGWRSMVAVAAGALVLSAAPLRAQGGTTTGDSAYSTTTTTTQQQPEHHDFPWGLLGLLGLAGLLGRRRPEVTHREEVHVRPTPRMDDVRVHPTTPVAGTTPADDLRVRPNDPAGPPTP